MQTDTKLTELINKFKNNKNVTEEDINLLKSIATDLKVSQKRVGLNYDHSQLDQEDASNLMQGNKLFFQNKRDLNISFNEKGMTNNALIEGDNFYALSKMKEMGKKFEVIYIDPPYNTGNDDLGYEDKRIGSEDGFKHSKWLAFMEPRLKLAQQLLTDDGVIFVSIDDHEQAYLKVMMDKIFGEQNFIDTLIWKKNSVKNNTNFFSNVHEYIFAFAKHKKTLLNSSNVPFFEEKPGYKEVSDITSYILSKNITIQDKKEQLEKKLKELYKNNPKYKGISQYKYVDVDKNNNLRIYRKSDIGDTGNRNNKFDVLHPITQKVVSTPARGWLYNAQKMSELIEKNLISFGEDEKTVPSYKRYLDTVPFNRIQTIIQDYTDGIKEFNNLTINNQFSFPKPTTLIKKIIGGYQNKNVHVLDFFAGTGTTGQAVLELNQEDGGHRQFTLVTSKEREDNIARTITYKRLSKVINGYTTPKGKEVAGIHANLSYYLGDIDQLVLEDEVDFGMVDDAVINEDKASTYAIKENAVLIKQFNDSTFLFKNKDKQYTLIGEGLQDNLELEKYLEIDDELVIYDLGLDSQLIHQIEDNFKVKSVINLEDSRLPKYLDIEL